MLRPGDDRARHSQLVSADLPADFLIAAATTLMWFVRSAGVPSITTVDSATTGTEFPCIAPTRYRITDSDILRTVMEAPAGRPVLIVSSADCE